MKDKTMQEVLDKGEKKESRNSSNDKGENVEGLPRRNSIEHQKIDQKRDNYNGIPLCMSK